MSNVGWLKYEFNNFSEFRINSLSIEQITEKILNFYEKEKNYKNKFNELRKEILKRNNFDNTILKYKELITNLINRTI